MKTIKELEAEKDTYEKGGMKDAIAIAKYQTLEEVIKLIDEMPLGNYNKQLDEFRIKLKARIEGTQKVENM